MSLVVHVVVWLNSIANMLGKILLAPIGVLPGWLSSTVVAAATGVLLLVVFKYTSNQRAIKRVKDDIKANLLALKLFKDSAWVALRAQGRVLYGSLRLLILAVIPMLVMLVPVLLILGQLALWYQARPLQKGEEAVVTLKLNQNLKKGSGARGQGSAGTQAARDYLTPDPSPLTPASWPEVRLEPAQAIQTTVGPVSIRSKDEVCWNIKALADGRERLVFHVGEDTGDKELAIGNGFMPVSKLRPASDWLDALLNPHEAPFPSDSPIHSIEIAYPERSSWTSGTNSWVIYWFVVSMAAGLCFRRVLRVNL